MNENIFEKICRICVRKFNNLCALSDTEGDIPLLVKYCVITGYEIPIEDEYPKQICKSCRRRLDSSFKFYNLCMGAELALCYFKEEQMKKKAEEEKRKKIAAAKEETQFYIIFDESQISDEQLNYEDVQLVCPSDVQACPNIFYNKSKDKKHTCKVCKKKFTTSSRVKLHIQRLHKEYYLKKCKVTCHKCGMKFIQQRNLRRHLVYHNTDSYFACDFCAVKTYSKKSWRQHIKTHDAPINIICKICNKTITSQVSYIYHTDYHRTKEILKNQTLFSCETCQIHFKTYEDIEKHCLTRHSSEIPAGKTTTNPAPIVWSNEERSKLIDNYDKTTENLVDYNNQNRSKTTQWTQNINTNTRGMLSTAPSKTTIISNTGNDDNNRAAIVLKSKENRIVLNESYLLNEESSNFFTSPNHQQRHSPQPDVSYQDTFCLHILKEERSKIDRLLDLNTNINLEATVSHPDRFNIRVAAEEEESQDTTNEENKEKFIYKLVDSSSNGSKFEESTLEFDESIETTLNVLNAEGTTEFEENNVLDNSVVLNMGDKSIIDQSLLIRRRQLLTTHVEEINANDSSSINIVAGDDHLYDLNEDFLGLNGSSEHFIEADDHSSKMVVEEWPPSNTTIINCSNKNEHSLETDDDLVSKKSSTVTFKCNLCTRFYKNLSDLKYHVNDCYSKMNRPKSFMCDICGHTFSSSWTLANHKNGHSSNKPYICDICGQGFKWHNDLSNHKSRIHEQVRPYVCKVCGKRCGTSATLKSHFRFHTGERPYVCSICNVSFTQNSSLKEHMFKHTGGFEESCPICNKIFKTPLRLRTHIKRHNSQRKLYPCDICDRLFTEKSSVTKHKIKIHKEEHHSSKMLESH